MFSATRTAGSTGPSSLRPASWLCAGSSFLPCSRTLSLRLPRCSVPRIGSQGYFPLPAANCEAPLAGCSKTLSREDALLAELESARREVASPNARLEKHYQLFKGRH